MFPSCLWAQGLGLTPNLLPNFGERSPEPRPTPSVPDPTQLTAQWWRYFQVDDLDELGQRVSLQRARLDEIKATLPAEVAQSAQPLFELLDAHLRALLIAKAQRAPDPPPALVFADRYSLGELLQIQQQLRAVRGRLPQVRRDVNDTDQTVRALQRQIDTSMSSYSGLPANDSRRLLLGLEMMTRRVEMAVGEERLRVRRALLRVTEEQLKNLERALVQARDLVVREHSTLLVMEANSAVERANARYQQQRVLAAQISEVIAEMTLLQRLAEQQLNALLRNERPENLVLLRSQRLAWIASLQSWREQLDQWGLESERERGRLGELPSAETDLIEANRLNAIDQRRLRQIQENLTAIEKLREQVAAGLLLMDLLGDQLLLLEGRFSDWLERSRQWRESAWNELLSWALMPLFRSGDTPVTPVGLLRVILIVMIAWWLSYWLRRGLQRFAEGSDEGESSAYTTFGRLAQYIIIPLGMGFGLISIGVDLTNFALVASALAIGIGFGMQSIVNNFISGLILLFERTLRVGDFVELASGIAGEVRYINVRSTVINTNDNVDIVVPNSEFVNSKVTNWTLLENYRRIHLPFRVAYGSDKELVKLAGLEAAEKVPHTLTGLPGKTPSVWLVNLGENAMEFELVVWITHRAVKRPAAVHAAYLWEIESALRKYGLRIPLPQRDLHLKSGFDDRPMSAVHLEKTPLAKPPTVEDS